MSIKTMPVTLRTSNIALSLVLHNELKHLPRLLDSIEKQTCLFARLYAFDNNSRDGGAELIQQRFPDALVTFSADNLGYGAGHNHNARMAFEAGASAIFIINTDVELAEQCLEALADGMEECTHIGILSPLIFYGNQTGKTREIQFYGAQANFPKWKKNNPWVHQVVDDMDELPDTSSSNLVSGTAFLVRKVVFDKIGLFDESLFLYGEEMDFCYRAECHKISTMALKSAQIWHYHQWSKNHSRAYAREYYYINRNKIRFFKKYGFWPGLLRYLLLEGILSGYKGWWCIRKGGSALLLAYYRGIMDGLLNKSGASMQ
jgi:GT2 family glycosyltransferase